MNERFVEVIDAPTLSARIQELGHQIGEEFLGKVPMLIGVLQGAVPFLADLVRSISIEVDVDFLALSRFGEGGRVRIAMDTLDNMEERHILVVEDIVDTGLTLNVMRELFQARGVASISTVTLLDKASRRLVDVPLEFRGFEVGDEFLLGYGLDWEGRFRNLPSIWAVLDLPGFVEDPASFSRQVFSRHGDRLGR